MTRARRTSSFFTIACLSRNGHSNTIEMIYLFDLFIKTEFGPNYDDEMITEIKDLGGFSLVQGIVTGMLLGFVLCYFLS